MSPMGTNYAMRHNLQVPNPPPNTHPCHSTRKPSTMKGRRSMKTRISMMRKKKVKSQPTTTTSMTCSNRNNPQYEGSNFTTWTKPA
ncbi:hypothetical protein GOBAR_AA36920 [Gossypium barbadense]|uniref:Uncharacterized protein n=1 Tax=Gossypium barbadense TaxID=3634 RepID=A0A2P5VY93_GOSBA|nr:hypothetical protein GOBAR_AA36920 [Gossypium barbadense]